MFMQGGKRAAKYLYSVIKDEITFTQAFHQAIVNKLAQRKQPQFLRLQISAGEGCQGYTYKFKFDKELNEKDHVALGKDANVVFALGKQQFTLVQGSTLDYVKQMMRETFYVKENPNAELSCSCKTSFSPKEFVL